MALVTGANKRILVIVELKQSNLQLRFEYHQSFSGLFKMKTNFSCAIQTYTQLNS